MFPWKVEPISEEVVPWTKISCANWRSVSDRSMRDSDWVSRRSTPGTSRKRPPIAKPTTSQHFSTASTHLGRLGDRQPGRSADGLAAIYPRHKVNGALCRDTYGQHDRTVAQIPFIGSTPVRMRTFNSACCYAFLSSRRANTFRVGAATPTLLDFDTATHADLAAANGGDLCLRKKPSLAAFSLSNRRY